MFIPLGFFISFALARRFWWVAIVASAGFSALAEILQGVFLPQRFSSLGDVIANTTGPSSALRSPCSSDSSSGRATGDGTVIATSGLTSIRTYVRISPCGGADKN